MQALDLDIYPSRLGAPAHFTPRQDPVVYGQVDQGPLSAEQLQEYESQGRLLLPNLFAADEVRQFRAELERMLNDTSLVKRPEIVFELSSQTVRSIFAFEQFSDLFAGVLADARIGSVARQLLGSEVYVHQSRINIKPALDGKEFFWHSDFETWHVEDGMPRMRAVSCSIWLDDNTQFNGALMVIPGSHKTYLSCSGQTPENNYQQSLRRQVYGVPDRQSLGDLVERHGLELTTGPAGSALFFDCNLMHGSAGNLSPQSRSNLFVVFNSVENRLVEPYCGLEPRPPYIARR